MSTKALPTVKTSSLSLDPEIIFGEQGPIAKSFDNYESRPVQVEMAKRVRSAMKEEKHLFCEAGTGTGKSYAFLLPAIELALSGQGPVVISTNTISLQDQIFKKDIPDLKKYLNLPNLKVVLRKGRGNYLSRRRLKIAFNYPWTDGQVSEIEDIENWVDTTKSGSLQDLDFIPQHSVWGEVRSDQYDCLGSNCPTFKECFYFKARDKAASAHIIITNHSLLSLDLLLRSKTDGLTGILPEFKHLVIDEAHTLEDSIRSADTFEWKQKSAVHLVSRLTNRRNKGVLDAISSNGNIPQTKITPWIQEAIKYFQSFIKFNDDFFTNTVAKFLATDARKVFKLEVAKRVKPGNLTGIYSSNLLSSIKSGNSYLSRIHSELGRIVGANSDKIASYKEGISKAVIGLYVLLSKHVVRFKEVESHLKRTIAADKLPEEVYPTHVSSATVVKVNGKLRYGIVNTPIFVRKITKKILFDRVASITLASATLTTNNQFAGITRNLGANSDKLETLKLPHVFDYQQQVKLYLTPKALLDPWNDAKAREKYYDNLAGRVEKYVFHTNGNAFILCTSNKLMKALFDRTHKKFENRGMQVLLQNSGLTRDQMLREFKLIANSVLYGVDSFWEGIDVPGNHLQNVIIPKLPFPPPTPLSEAQKEMYDIWNRGKPRSKQRNFFSDRVVPSVAIKLQQGFGRLIRHKKDSGIVVILDPRLKTKYYGQALLGSLPSCPTVVEDE